MSATSTGSLARVALLAGATLAAGCGGSKGNNGSPGISVAIATHLPSTLLAAASAPVAAHVDGDGGGMGVDWSLSCGSPGACGSITGHTASDAAATYAAPASPPGGPVRVTARSTADPSRSAQESTTIVEIAVQISAHLPGTLAVGTSAAIAAHVSNDAGNLGVNWSLSCGSPGACGSITGHTASDAAATYAAPPSAPGGPVLVSATSAADATKQAQESTVVIPVGGPALLSGEYAFRFVGVDPTSRLPVALAGTFVADGAGNVTGGTEDWNTGTPGTPASLPIDAAPASTYGMGPDRRGTIALATAARALQLDFVLDADGNGRFIEIGHLSGSGVFEKRDAAAFPAADLNGRFVMELVGITIDGLRAAAGAVFEADGSGGIANGESDVDAAQLTFSGTCASDPATGRGTAALSFAGGREIDLAYYVVTADELFLVESGNSSIPLSGLARRQIAPAGGFSTASLSGSHVIFATGTDRARVGSAALAGTFDVAAPGQASGAIDSNLTSSTASQSFASLAYAVASSGRGTVALPLGSVTLPMALYLYGEDRGFAVSAGPASPDVSLGFAGEILPQAGRPYAPEKVRLGSYALGTEPPGHSYDENDLGGCQVGAGAQLSLLMDFSYYNGIGGWGQGVMVPGSFTLDSTGRGRVLLTNGPSTLVAGLYALSPSDLLLLTTLDSQDQIPVLDHCRQ